MQVKPKTAKVVEPSDPNFDEIWRITLAERKQYDEWVGEDNWARHREMTTDVLRLIDSKGVLDADANTNHATTAAMATGAELISRAVADGMDSVIALLRKDHAEAVVQMFLRHYRWFAGAK